MGFISRKSIQADIRKVSPKEEYIAKSPTDLLAYTLINDWNTCRDAIMRYIQVSSYSRGVPIMHVKGQVNNLWMAVRSSYNLSKWPDKVSIETMDELVRSKLFDDLYKAYLEIDAYLYRKGPTKWDTKKYYDEHDIAEENKRINVWNG